MLESVSGKLHRIKHNDPVLDRADTSYDFYITVYFREHLDALQQSVGCSVKLDVQE